MNNEMNAHTGFLATVHCCRLSLVRMLLAGQRPSSLNASGLIVEGRRTTRSYHMTDV